MIGAYCAFEPDTQGTEITHMQECYSTLVAQNVMLIYNKRKEWFLICEIVFLFILEIMTNVESDV
jgi:hypothetical protein